MTDSYCFEQSQPKVSIGVPIYNAEYVLARALDSLKRQTHTNLEIIICDDGSTDNTQAICSDYTKLDARIQYHRSSVNRGIPTNFAWALALATADYFMWAADDDEWDPHYIEVCLAPLTSDPNLILSGSATKVVGQNDEDSIIDYGLTTMDQPPAIRYKMYREISDHADNFGGIFYGIYRKKHLLAVSPMPPVVCNDHILLAQLTLRGSFFTNKKILMQKARGGVSKNHKSNARAQRATHAIYARWPYLIREMYYQKAVFSTDTLLLLEKIVLSVWSWKQYGIQLRRVERSLRIALKSDLHSFKKALKSNGKHRYRPQKCPMWTIRLIPKSGE